MRLTNAAARRAINLWLQANGRPPYPDEWSNMGVAAMLRIEYKSVGIKTLNLDLAPDARKYVRKFAILRASAYLPSSTTTPG